MQEADIQVDEVRHLDFRKGKFFYKDPIAGITIGEQKGIGEIPSKMQGNRYIKASGTFIAKAINEARHSGNKKNNQHGHRITQHFETEPMVDTKSGCRNKQCIAASQFFNQEVKQYTPENQLFK